MSVQPEVVDTAAAAADLAARALDPARRRPLVAVAARSGTPLLDVAGLLATLGERATVHLVTSTDATWELKRRLPAGLDVYGDAVRVWRPGLGPASSPDEHPLVLLDDATATDPAVLDEVAAAVTAAGRTPAGPTRTEQVAVVVAVRADEAVVRLGDGTPAILPAAAVARVSAPLARLVRVAQTLRVRVTGWDGRRRLLVSAAELTPDPRERLATEAPVGSSVVGRVSALRSYGALVELLPGVEGLVHVSEVADEHVAHPEERLRVDQRVRARVLAHEGTERVLLSLRDVPPGGVRPALLPDGPPWLPDDEPEPAVLPLAAELPPGPSFGDHAPRPAATGDGIADQIRELDAAAERARSAGEDYRRLVASTERHLADLRAQAASVVHDLEQDLADARQRVLVTLEDASAGLVDSTQSALDQARAEVRRLRAELATATEEGRQLRQDLDHARTRAERAERGAQRSRADAHQRRETAAALREELDARVPESQRLVAAIRSSWARRTTAADRERYRWRDPVVGPEFLESLRRVEGIGLDRVHEVCAEVACGRAPDRPGLAVHPLRATDGTGNGSRQRVREDGALAFRASLQVRTAAARRLHYWVLPDGQVELAKIGYHDDFTIA
ncbi:S1 RNA-binding domain-containing protein [Nocardioides sp. LML1-1-1.1]|uniref:S1 RNA-binding domain-containing protein n=1 Tax=Nocardioides sp. LML1-1-1.1 TaxID=3135248 RepID=UPI003449790E